MQDASAQMALLQFMTCGMSKTAVPGSIHCDHLIVGKDGTEYDLTKSIATNKEVFDFLQSCGEKYGIQFWGPGSGYYSSNCFRKLFCSRLNDVGN